MSIINGRWRKIRILLAYPGVIIDKLNVNRQINHSSLFHLKQQKKKQYQRHSQLCDGFYLHFMCTNLSILLHLHSFPCLSRHSMSPQQFFFCGCCCWRTAQPLRIAAPILLNWAAGWLSSVRNCRWQCLVIVEIELFRCCWCCQWIGEQAKITLRQQRAPSEAVAGRGGEAKTLNKINTKR